MPPRDPFDPFATPTLDPIKDISRRRLLTAIPALGLIAAGVSCGDEGEGEDATDSEETRSVSHAFGTTEIPVRPQRIVTTQDQNGLLPLLELGVRPIASAALQQPNGTHLFRRTEGYDTSEIANAGDYWEVDLEKIAAQQPDLIIAHEFNEEIYPQLSAIAPTVAIQVFERPMTDVLRDFAEAVGAIERWEELHREYQEQLEALKGDLSCAAEDLVVSWIEFNEDGSFFVQPNWQAVGTIMAEMGFARPELQRGLSDWVDYPMERLRDHDGDVIITANFGEEQDDPGIAAIRAQPVFQQLDAVTRDEFHVFDGTEMVGSSFGKMTNFIAFLRRTIVEREVNLPGGHSCRA